MEIRRPRLAGVKVPLWAASVLVYLLARAFAAVVILVAARHQLAPPWVSGPVGYWDMATLWDGGWFRAIATDGYPDGLPVDRETGGVGQSPWAFYPLFPMMSRLMMLATGQSFDVVGPMVALVAGGGAAVVIAYLLQPRVGYRVAIAAVAVVAAFPSSPILQVAYSDATALLMVPATLLALVNRRWLLAGALGLLTGLTRPIAPPLAAVALFASWRRWSRRRERPLGWRETAAMGAGLAMFAASPFVWPVVVGVVTGEPLGYFATLGAWRTDSDNWQLFNRWRGLSPAQVVIYFTVVSLPTVLAAAGPWARRLGPVLRAWTIVYASFLAVTVGPIAGFLRHALLLFPLAVVVLGGGWEDRPVRDLHTRATTLVVIGLAGQAWWIWTLLRYTTPAEAPP